MTRSGLAALYDASRRPWVSWSFLTACVVVTLGTLAWPPLGGILGGIERRYPWQPFTAVFAHGWPGFPALVHLGLNAFLILELGPACERLLGRGRFLALGLASTAANAGLQLVTEGVNGSSLVIWSWGPPLFVALRASGESGTAPATRLRGILGLVYLVIPLGMAGLPFAFGWRGNPLVALVRANQFHLLATLVGVVLAVVWRERIRGGGFSSSC